ncbi:hypothetical protein BD779DRAFT_1445846, partial [Infundibulicybe gibba]
MASYFVQHNCVSCNLYTTVFRVSPGRRKKETAKLAERNRFKCPKRGSKKPVTIKCPQFHDEVGGSEVLGDASIFPPEPLSEELVATIVTGFCKDSSPEVLEESGCAVCGQLVPI